MSSEHLHGVLECFSSTFKNTFTVLKKGTRVIGITEMKKMFPPPPTYTQIELK